MSSGNISGQLPSLDPNTVDATLPNKTVVRVVDMINISQSHERQLNALNKETLPLSGQTINELDDDDDNDNDNYNENERNAAAASRSRSTIKYTVKDSEGNMAFMLLKDSAQVRLKLGSTLVLAGGTYIWRSVLVPRSNQISQINGGTDLSTNQQIARLRLQPA